MLLRWILAALHLTALVFGSAAIFSRARAFGSSLNGREVKHLFAADAWWGGAALLWIGTGFWRIVANTEMPAAFYFASAAFWLKMSLLGVILVLEIWPMVTLARWRVALRRGQPIDSSRARLFATISWVQLLLVVLMVFAATAMSRGIGLR